MMGWHQSPLQIDFSPSRSFDRFEAMVGELVTPVSALVGETLPVFVGQSPAVSPTHAGPMPPLEGQAEVPPIVTVVRLAVLVTVAPAASVLLQHTALRSVLGPTAVTVVV